MRRKVSQVNLAIAALLLGAVAVVIVRPGCSSPKEPVRQIPARLFVEVDRTIQDMALMSEGRVAVSDWEWVKVFDDEGQLLEEIQFQDMVYTILVYDEGQEFMVTLGDQTVWKADEDGMFQQIESIPFTADFLSEDGKILIHHGLSNMYLRNLETGEKYELPPPDTSVGGVLFDEEEQMLYVGSTDYGVYDSVRGDDQHSLYCFDLRKKVKKWEVWADDVNGLAIIDGRLVSSERRAIRILDKDTGKILDEQEVGIGSWSRPTVMDSFLFDRYVLHPISGAGFEVWDLKGEGGIERIAEIEAEGRLVSITNEGLVYFGGIDVHKVFVADLSALDPSRSSLPTSD